MLASGQALDCCFRAASGDDVPVCRDLGHLEVESAKPEGAALLIAETGYRSHFIDAKSLINANESAAEVEARFLAADAQKCRHKWQAHETESNQLSLFWSGSPVIRRIDFSMSLNHIYMMQFSYNNHIIMILSC